MPKRAIPLLTVSESSTNTILTYRAPADNLRAIPFIYGKICSPPRVIFCTTDPTEFECRVLGQDERVRVINWSHTLTTPCSARQRATKESTGAALTSYGIIDLPGSTVPNSTMMNWDSRLCPRSEIYRHLNGQ